MRQIISYITGFFRKDFHPGYYVSILFMLTGGIILNYRYDFKNRFILDYSNSHSYFFRWFIFFFFVYFIVLLIQSAWKKDYALFRNRVFLMKISIGLLLLAFDSYSRDFFVWIMKHGDIPRPLIRWTYYMFTNLNQFIYLGLAMFVLKRMFDRHEKNVYGLTLKNISLKPYFIMLLIVVPFVAWASFQQDFLRSYPVYKDNFNTVSQYLSPWKAIGSFELFYALRFIAVEVFFRGFLIIGMVRLIGERALIPMVVLYSFWHFGKPMAETIGAAFGGYILGIIALRSGSVSGAIILHYGIALLMEAGAFIQLSLLKK